ncbi:uncharacterized protein LOC106011587 [Aplysia californica]|uniref:Uncharacterized protein LOC106011587 n=1 Tax=Aplysia californica TaxID=6500 RepID=A0ABM0ZYI8_APLCA|nr:uncharacterized protein LOC106011587 [Aplysia californica]
MECEAMSLEAPSSQGCDVTSHIPNAPPAVSAAAVAATAAVAAADTVAGTSGADDVEEVTETKIIGVTETGVIRKRSFKRKVRKEETPQRMSFGQDKDVYRKIVDRVMNERLVSGTLEGLQERWKMISYMHADCMDMVTQWEKKREAKLQARRKDPRLYMLVAGGSAFVLFLLWSLVRCIW